MSVENPIRSKVSGQTQTKTYDFTILGIVADEEDIEGVEQVFQIKEFCTANSIPISYRLFNSNKYEEDSLYIKELPSFYVCIKKMPQRVFTTEDDPVKQIRNEMARSNALQEAKQEEAKKRNEWWSNQINGVRSLFQAKHTKHPMASK